MTQNTKEIAALIRLMKQQADAGDEDDEEIDAEMTPDKLARILRKLRPQQSTRVFQSREETIEKLQTHLKTYLEDHQLAVGDIVRWKAGMKNRSVPAYGEPVIIVEILKEPVVGGDDSGTPYFREQLTVKLGWIDPDGDFVCFHYDGSRFRKFDE